MFSFNRKINLPGWFLFFSPPAYWIYLGIDFMGNIDWIYTKIPSGQAVATIAGDHPLITTMIFMFLGLGWLYLFRSRYRNPVQYLEYCFGREDLNDKYPMDELLLKYSVWAYWLSGRGVLTKYTKELQKRPIERLLFPKPNEDSPTLKMLPESLQGGKRL